MNIELKGIRVHDRMSDETTAFDASLYIDGKKVGTAHNRGCGGPTDYQPDRSDDFEVIRKAEEYCKSLPDRIFPKDEFTEEFSVPMTLEQKIDELLDDYLEKKNMGKFEKKKLKRMETHILWGDQKSYREYGWPKFTIAQVLNSPKGPGAIKDLITRLKAEYPNDKLLNTNIPNEIL